MSRIPFLILAALVANSVQAGTDANPALEWLGSSVVFYAGFDSDEGGAADISADNPAPLVEKSPVEYASGVFGKAFLCQNRPLCYPITESLRFDRPGALLLWVSLKNRSGAEEPAYLHFWRWAARSDKASNSISISRMGGLPNKETLFAYIDSNFDGVAAKQTLKNGNTLQWNPGEWHLLALSWSGELVRFSVDGSPLSATKPYPGLGTLGALAKNALLTIGSQHPGEENAFLIDEVLILNRSLGDDEIARIHREGLAAIEKQKPLR